ncbi:MAG: acyl-CoA dehydrogenase family protein [Kofleriaceae bacterium]|nr:acyl-CoA dehydrogenase family protein [Kofleriaceae bacterium]MCB9574663.1 acyl-CoA dehydrogenase family protein [Kofleriaceae bacterium]
MSNYFTDNDDLQWYFETGLAWDELATITEYDYRAPDGHKTAREAIDFYREVATMVGELAATEIAPHAAEIDREGVHYEGGEVRFPKRLAAIFEQLKGLDLHGMCLPRELGGMNAPMLLYYLNSELLARADVSVMAHHGFHGGIAMALLIFSILEGSTEIDAAQMKIVKTRFGDAIAEIARGEAWGCMDITEPDAGSDMAALRTVGEQDADGNWFVTGQKIFITSGHGKYHFVIARTEKPVAGTEDDPYAGLGGLSFFLVKAYEDRPDGTRVRYATLDRVEDKLGHHGSVTGSLTFERSPALLVGERGKGFQQMLVLMNNARLGVGFESIGLCEAAYRLARDYAAGRPSMGKTIDRHEMIADYLDEMRTDIQGLRALAMHGAWHEEMAEKERLRLRFEPPTDDVGRADLDRRIARHKRKARRVTPLLKYLAAEKAVEMARRCLQIHGGNGYMKEYGAEKLLRDALVMPIYEGTSQIQALMAMKDTLGGIIKNPQEFVRRRAQAQWRATTARDPLERRVAKLQTVSLGAQQHLMTRTAADKVRSLPGKPLTEWPRAFLKNWDPKRDFAFAMLHAERLIRILADEAVAELLLAQARKHPERREVLERWLERAEPRSRFLADEIATTGDRLLGSLSDGPAADHADATAAQAAG